MESKVLTEIQYIPPAEINLENTAYLLSPLEEQPDDDLLSSIGQWGILQPPILLEQQEDYIIITGRKRIKAARHCKKQQNIPCLVLPPTTDPKTICAILFEELLNGRQPSFVEQITFFELFLESASMTEAFPYLERLGYKPQEHILKGLLKLRALDNDVILALHRGILSPKSCSKLLDLAKNDQLVIIKLITHLRLGGSKQRKLIELSTELIKRENQPLEQILARYKPVELEKSQNIPQQAAALLDCLKHACFPRLSKATKHFRKKVASLNLPPNMEVKPSPSFEEDSITLTIRCPDWKELVKALEKLK